MMESVLAEVSTVEYSDLSGDPPEEITGHEHAMARREAPEALDTRHTIVNLEITVAGKKRR